MLILGLNFWRADGTCFIFSSGVLIFHSTEITTTSQSSAMSPLTQYIHILPITILFFSKMAGVWEVFSHSFLWAHFQLWLCYCSSMCAARETVHLFKLFQPSYFSAYQPFHPFKIFIFLPLQLLHTFSFMFIWRNCSAIKLFTFFKLFQPSYVSASLSEHAYIISYQQEQASKF